MRYKQANPQGGDNNSLTLTFPTIHIKLKDDKIFIPDPPLLIVACRSFSVQSGPS